MTPDEIKSGERAAQDLLSGIPAGSRTKARQRIRLIAGALSKALRELRDAQVEIAKAWAEYRELSLRGGAAVSAKDAQIAELQHKAIHANEDERLVTEDRNRLLGLRLEDEGRIATVLQIIANIPDSSRYHFGNDKQWRACQICQGGEYVGSGYDPHSPECPWNYVRRILAALAAPAPTASSVSVRKEYLPTETIGHVDSMACGAYASINIPTVKDSFTVQVCKLCGSEAEFCADENVWRHKGDPSDKRYFTQTFCNRYGYPIEVEPAPKGFPMYCRDIKQLCDEKGNPKLPEQGKGEHNALADARWNKTAFESLLSLTPAELAIKAKPDGLRDAPDTLEAFTSSRSEDNGL